MITYRTPAHGMISINGGYNGLTEAASEASGDANGSGGADPEARDNGVERYDAARLGYEDLQQLHFDARQVRQMSVHEDTADRWSTGVCVDAGRHRRRYPRQRGSPTPEARHTYSLLDPPTTTGRRGISEVKSLRATTEQVRSHVFHWRHLVFHALFHASRRRGCHHSAMTPRRCPLGGRFSMSRAVAARSLWRSIAARPHPTAGPSYSRVSSAA